MGANRDREPWAVRVHSLAGSFAGAGMVLGTAHVLTCAHVVTAAAGGADDSDAAPTAEIAVDVVDRPGLGPVPARVAAGGWIPRADDERGDIALLELGRPLPEGIGAPLRRLSLSWGRAVHAFGFPNGLDNGEHVTAELAGWAGPGREWVQMNTAPGGRRVRLGFSGAAVVDSETGYVVGMVVGEYTDDSAGLAWMIPVETIVHYVPRVLEWVSGDSSVDDPFRRFDPARGDVRVARQVADFFARRMPRNVMVIVSGEADSGVSAALRRAVVLANRELRPPGADPARLPEQDVPPVGSIDLALDVSGKTVEEVSRRIADWMGAPADDTTGSAARLAAGALPRSIVVDNIDEAADPDALVSDVLKPLVGQAADRDVRLLLGFRREAIRQRLAVLDLRIGELRASEEALRRLHRHVAARIAGVAEPPARATALRMALTALRAADAVRDRDRLLAELDAGERTTDRALRRLDETRRHLDGLLALRAELRGRVEAYRARAVAAGLAEDAELGELYRTAHELLWQGPSDLTRAVSTVDRYAREVRAALSERDRDGEAAG